MQGSRSSRQFEVEAVRLVRERGASVVQASRDFDVHENVLRKWVKEFGSDPVQAFPGLGQMKPEQLEDRAAATRGRHSADNGAHRYGEGCVSFSTLASIYGDAYILVPIRVFR